jgi:hypothetical protein
MDREHQQNDSTTCLRPENEVVDGGKGEKADENRIDESVGAHEVDKFR